VKAYGAYLRGRGYLQLWKDDDLRQSIGAFQEAVTEDPSYARAYAAWQARFSSSLNTVRRKPIKT